MTPDTAVFVAVLVRNDIVRGKQFTVQIGSTCQTTAAGCCCQTSNRINRFVRQRLLALVQSGQFKFVDESFVGSDQTSVRTATSTNTTTASDSTQGFITSMIPFDGGDQLTFALQLDEFSLVGQIITFGW